MCVCARARACVCKGWGRVILVRHLCVLRVRFWCLELCIFLFECLMYAPWAQLRRGTQRPHHHHYYHYQPRTLKVRFHIVGVAEVRLRWQQKNRAHGNMNTQRSSGMHRSTEWQHIPPCRRPSPEEIWAVVFSIFSIFPSPLPLHCRLWTVGFMLLGERTELLCLLLLFLLLPRVRIPRRQKWRSPVLRIQIYQRSVQ